MGFFDKPVVTCAICGNEIGKKEKRWELKDGNYICPDCQAPFGKLNGSKGFISYDKSEFENLRQKTVKYNDLLAENKKIYNSLSVNQIVENCVFFDDEKEKWYFDSGERAFFYFNDDAAIPPVFNFDDILEITIAKGGKTISATSTTRKEKGIRKALVGGLIAGPTGALLGGMMAHSKTSTFAAEDQIYYLNIIIDGENDPLVIPCPTEQVAESIRLALVRRMKDPVDNNSAEKSTPDPQSISTADEIRKFKQLLDDGIITQEEFDSKKKQLLGL